VIGPSFAAEVLVAGKWIAAGNRRFGTKVEAPSNWH
jgi:hypothetical protein